MICQLKCGFVEYVATSRRRAPQVWFYQDLVGVCYMPAICECLQCSAQTDFTPKLYL